MPTAFRVTSKLLARARLARIGAVLLFVMMASILTSVGALQMLQHTGAQLAEQIIGRAGGVIQVAGYSTLGKTRSTSAEDANVEKVLRGNGNRAERTGWLILQQPIDQDPRLRVNLEENEWTQKPYPDRLHLLTGIWPSKSGEAVVARDMAPQFPLGSTVSVAGNSLRLIVVGVAVDDYARSQPAIFVGPGTWAHALATSSSSVQSREIAGQRLFFYANPTDSTQLGAAVAKSLPAGSNQQAVIFDRAETEASEPPNYLEENLLVALGPLAGGFLAGLIIFRSFSQNRALLWTLGLPYRKTRLPSLLVSSALIVVGWVGGTAAGFAILPVLHFVLDANLNARPNEPRVLASLVLATAPGTIIGSIAASALASNRSLRFKAQQRQVAGRARSRKLLPITPFIAGLCILVGVFSCQGSRDADSLLLGASLFGTALVLLSPFALRLLWKLPAKRPALNLVLRRLQADKSFELPLVASSLLLLIAISSITFINSSVAATNESNRPTVLPGQIQLRSKLSAGSTISADEVRRYQSAASLSSPISAYDVTDLVVDLNGPVLAVRSLADADRFFGAKLDAGSARALNEGLVLRPSLDDVRQRTFQAEDGERTIPVRGFAGPDASKSWGGVVLNATLSRYKVRPDVRIWVFTDLSETEVAAGARVAAKVGLPASNVLAYAAPDRFSLPLAALSIALGLMIANGFILAATASADTRRLRPSLAGLRAIGVSSSWVTRVVALRTVFATAAPIVVAILGGGLGVAAAIVVSGLHYSLVVPFALIAPTAASVVIAGLVVGFVSAWRLKRAEWQIT